MGSKSKRALALHRIEELKRLCKAEGFQLFEFSPIHFRVVGRTRVDYWPSTSKAWITDSAQKGEKRTPVEVVQLARLLPLDEGPLLPEGAQEHLRSLQ